MKMALNIDLDGFEYLSDSDATKLSPTLKQQPPVSPIESESSSGISSLDSDDLKKQLLSSPTISHDDEDQQSDGDGVVASGSEKGEEKDADDDDEEEEVEEEEDEDKHEEKVEMNENDSKTDELKLSDDEKKNDDKVMEQPSIAIPVKVMYQNRDILDLSTNLIGSGRVTQFAHLPENNVTCFLQNRAQYWRLSSGERQENTIENCPCCDFTYPSTQLNLNQGPMITKKPSANAISDSLIMFLNTMDQMNNNNHINNNNNNNSGSNMNMFNTKQRMNVNNISQFAYQQQPTYQQHYQQQQNNVSGGGFNGNFNQQQQPQMNPFMNSTPSYGQTLALLSMMNNATCNAASAFRAINNNPQRYYNNNQSSMNNGFGLYKQF